MKLVNPHDYKIKEFKKSSVKYKKYDVFLENKLNSKIKKVSFGDKRYGQYRDSTPLKLYKHLDNNDLERKRLYEIRHRKDDNSLYSPAWFSLLYLWS